jgi:hypothetical protein
VVEACLFLSLSDEVSLHYSRKIILNGSVGFEFGLVV